METRRKYLITDSEGNVYYIADTEPRNEESGYSTRFSVKAVDAVVSEILNHDDEAKISALCEVKTDIGSSVWVLAFGADCALVDARRWLNENDGADVRLLSVKEYDLYDCGKLRVGEVLASENAVPLGFESENVSALVEEILGFVCDGNAELCSHAICYSFGIDDPEELKAVERDCNSVGEKLEYPCFERFEELTSEGIRERCSYVWKEWLFFESTDSTLSFMRKHSETASTSDVWETLFWTFIYETWGGYDCQYPYLLYLGLRDGRFSRFIDDLEKVRDKF